MITITILTHEATSITFGSILVFNEAMTIETSKLPIEDEPISSIAEIINEGSKLELIESFIIQRMVTEENIPMHVRIKEAFTNIAALSKSFS
jgi:hypothetical protein